MGEDISYEEHVAINNQRLTSIRSSLSDVSTFSHACVELTKWCSDQRAFTAHFEGTLMPTLQVAMENGTKEMFDFTLTHDLMSKCFHHRKHLSKASANRINRWYEQLRRMKKNGGKRKRAPPKSAANANNNTQQPSEVAAAEVPLITENNNFVEAAPCDEGSTMWGGPVPMGMATPGSSTAAFGMPPQHYGTLPYGQMEGSTHMFEKQNMMMMRQHHHQQQQHQQMMHRMPMEAGFSGMAPGQPMMMTMTPEAIQHQQQQQQQRAMMMRQQYGHQQMAPNYGHHQMIRAGMPVQYGKMMAPQPMLNAPNPNEKMQHILVPQFSVVDETQLQAESHGLNFIIRPDVAPLLRSPLYDVLLSTWMPVKNGERTQLEVFINGKKILTSEVPDMKELVKNYIHPGENTFNYGYQASGLYHRLAVEFVKRMTLPEAREQLLAAGPMDPKSREEFSRQKYQKEAHSNQNKFVRIPLVCGLSKKKMETAARHRNCLANGGCFDLFTMLLSNKDGTRYLCPFCNYYIQFAEIEVDLFVGRILTSFPPQIMEVFIDRFGNVTPEAPPKEVEKEKPKRGKKRQVEDTNAIKRIKSESFVKAEMPSHDYHGYMPSAIAPVSVPVMAEWPKMQSPYGMQSPIQKAATPATPSLGCLNPPSNGSSHFNMCSPRQPMAHNGMHGPASAHDTIVEPSTSGSGSAPYTPTSVGNSEKIADGVWNLRSYDFYHPQPHFLDHENIVRQYLRGTKGCDFEGINTKCLEEPQHAAPAPAPVHQYQAQMHQAQMHQVMPHMQQMPHMPYMPHRTQITPPYDELSIGPK